MCRAILSYTIQELKALEPQIINNIEVITNHRPSKKHHRHRDLRPRFLIEPRATEGIRAEHHSDRQTNIIADTVPEPRPRTLTRIITNSSNTTTSRTKQLHLGHINVQSIMSSDKIDAIRLLLQSEDLHCLCLSETWAAGTVADKLLIFPGYQVIRCDRQKVRRGRKTAKGGGLAILVKDGITFTNLKLSGGHHQKIFI